MRQSADEAHGIGCDDRLFVVQPKPAGRRVERGEQLIGCIAFRPSELVEKRRLAGVRVSHERHGERIASAARPTLRAALLGEALELVAKLLDPHADHAAVELNLLLTRAARLPKAAALALQMGPAAHKPRGKVLEPSQLHLQTSFTALRASAKDFENELGSIKNRHLDAPLDVALLSGGKRDVEDNAVCTRLARKLAQLLNFSRAEKSCGIGPFAPGLHEAAGLEPVRSDEQAQLFGRIGIKHPPYRDRYEKGAGRILLTRFVDLKVGQISSPRPAGPE